MSSKIKIVRKRFPQDGKYRVEMICPNGEVVIGTPTKDGGWEATLKDDTNLQLCKGVGWDVAIRTAEAKKKPAPVKATKRTVAASRGKAAPKKTTKKKA